MVRVTATKGYEATAVADVLEASGVGRASFYELFEGKEQCFLAAHRVLVDDLYTRTEEAYLRPGSWPERVRSGLAAMLNWFASDPEIAQVTLIEVLAVGPAVRELFIEILDRFTSMLDEGREESDLAETLPNLSTIAGGALFARLYEEVLFGRTAELPHLLPELTYEVLLPFLGSESTSLERFKARLEK